MIQIVEKRKGILFRKVKNTKFLTNIPTLFKNAESIALEIPEKERFNIYYTLAHHKEGIRNARDGSFIKQEVIAFDIDHIKDLDIIKAKSYINPICKALGILPEKTGCVLSGNGIHFIIQINEFTNQDYFTKNKQMYISACKLIQRTLKDYGLDGDVDTGIFDAARILRLPFTTNIKRNEGIKKCIMLQSNIELQELEIEVIQEEKKEKITKDDVVPNFGTPDHETILKECEFIKWCKDNPNNVEEPIWYSLLSITSRFDDGNKASHDISSGYSGYIFEETNEKIEQAFNASPPKTCKTINNQWGKCTTCKHWEKIKSPINIKDKDFISTAHCGFTTISPKGGITRHYLDLYKQFNKEHQYKSVGGVSKIYKYNGTHYEIMDKKEIKNYAMLQFKPTPKSSEVDEFYKFIENMNYINSAFMHSYNTDGLINFKNGILNINTGELLAHSNEYAFFYCLPFDYNPDATCPNWEKFIEEFTLDRKCLQNILHEYMGYIIVNGNYKYHSALILSGTGKNGKTTFINTLRELIGIENHANIAISSIRDDKFALASLHGKLANFSEEEPPSCFKETGNFKTITGNALVTAQYKYGDTFQMLNKAKLVISYNEMPYMGDTSIGMKRRLLIIPCDLDLNTQDKKVDIELQNKLTQELSGIFNLALTGWIRLEQQKRFTKSKEVDEAVEEVLEHSDIVYSFLKENVTITPKAYIQFDELYNLYTIYNSKIGTGKNITKNGFARKLKQKNMTTVLLKKQGKVSRIFKNFALKRSSNALKSKKLF